MPGADVIPFFPALGASLILSAICVGLFTAMARRRRVLALPGQRRSHATPTPTGGGAGLILAVVLVGLLSPWRPVLPESWIEVVLPALVVLSVIGWLDDRASVPWVLRLLIQLAVSIWLVIWISVHAEPVGRSVMGGYLGLAIAVPALVWIMNAYNFMDGSDGMAGSQGVFAGFVLAGLFFAADATGAALAALTLALACLGFLPWNFPRPRVFMGDAGSVPLGFAFGALLIHGVTAGAFGLAPAVLVLAVFLCDSSLTLLKRVFRGERWYTAHNEHVYQRLIAQGWSHGRVLMLYQAINLLLLLPGIVMGTMYPDFAWLLTGALALILSVGWYAMSLQTRAAT